MSCMCVWVQVKAPRGDKDNIYSAVCVSFTVNKGRNDSDEDKCFAFMKI